MTFFNSLLRPSGIFLGLCNQIEQAGDFFRRASPAEGPEFLPGQAGFQMSGHIETLPPAIQDLEAGPGIVSPMAAVAEVDGAAQPGAAHFKVVDVHLIFRF
jgi:hypothetical protein